MPPSAHNEEELLAEIKKWKEIAEFQHAKRCWADDLSLGQGALDAYASTWPGFDAAVKAHVLKFAKAVSQITPIEPGWFFDTLPQDKQDEMVLVAPDELAALRLNDARYRWLRDESWAGYNISKSKPQVAETIVFIEQHGRVKTVLAEEALDEAVDAAIALDKAEARNAR